MQPESDYELGDPYIAEKKTQKASSNKAVVKGIYSLDLPDDSVRIVEYTDKKSGFIFQIFPRLVLSFIITVIIKKNPSHQFIYPFYFIYTDSKSA